MSDILHAIAVDDLQQAREHRIPLKHLNHQAGLYQATIRTITSLSPPSSRQRHGREQE
jgi:hypothetical protein